MADLLIVVDMQNDFITGPLGCQDAIEIVPYVARKIEYYGEQGLPVIFTRDTHNPETYLESLEGRLCPIKHCLPGTSGRLFPRSICEAGESVLFDQYYCVNKEGFGYPYWKELFDKNQIKFTSIEICGVMTSAAVMVNIMMLRGLYPNIPIMVDPKACADPVKERHAAALEVMESCQVDLLSVNPTGERK